jgi:hypothetical protein
MPPPIQIRALTHQETAELTRSEKFNTLHPVRCTQCGNTQTFERTMFWIGGVPKAEQHDDRTQGLIAHHLQQRYQIAHVFFKTYRNRFYVDSARCTHCDSTAIEFDIALTDDIIAAAAKLAGQSVADVRRAIEAQAERIAQQTRTREEPKRSDIGR